MCGFALERAISFFHRHELKNLLQLKIQLFKLGHYEGPARAAHNSYSYRWKRQMAEAFVRRPHRFGSGTVFDIGILLVKVILSINGNTFIWLLVYFKSYKQSIFLII